jgi:hypothetical protein
MTLPVQSHHTTVPTKIVLEQRKLRALQFFRKKAEASNMLAFHSENQSLTSLCDILTGSAFLRSGPAGFPL